MSGPGLLGTPAERRAYLATKLAVLAVAAALTVPLARWLGPRAWQGFGAFAAFLVLATAGVLAAAGRPGRSGPDETEEAGPPEGETPVTLPVEDALDLHPFAPADIPSVVEAYLEEAWNAGFREVRLIHGRGIGVQRERVRAVLARHPLVREIHDAPPERGGWGATIAHLVERRRPG